MRTCYLYVFFTVMSAGAIPIVATANSGDTIIAYNLALAARSQGDLETAYKLFKQACMAKGGMVDACIAWYELAKNKENEKDVKRSLGSAVMLAPNDIRGRALLAAELIKKKDYQWAKEHLTQAIPNAKAPGDRALLEYYLAYVFFKNQEYEEASNNFALARPDLPEDFQPRCDYYRALIAKTQKGNSQAVVLMKTVRSSKEETWADAADNALKAWSAFPRIPGFSGRLSGSFGLNTHPASAFLDDLGTTDSASADDVGTESGPVLQSVFRGDVIYSKDIGSYGLHGVFTAYREQNWTELDSGDDSQKTNDTGEDEYSPKDLNIAVFLGQLSLLSNIWSSRFEHELRLGIDGELQYMDHPPIKNRELNKFFKAEDTFELISWASGGKLWWSFARDSNAIYSIRLKIEGRPNYMDRDRSTIRFRLRLQHIRYYFERALQLKVMLGGRYDRAYYDPIVIKYDRLLHEAEINARWRTPVPRLTFLAGCLFKYNWYMNSRQNEKNSFRPKYFDVSFGEHMDPFLADYINSTNEHEYYELTRRDIEWEVRTELQLKLWRHASLAANYKHHQRLSPIDDTPVPLYINTKGTYERMPSAVYSYVRDIVTLELRQLF
ncbi:MAG: hypothetical protein GY847_36855 [Proteobacteria bacterium]|nr:hypothetical protein [Pseudomonadota bacterium]